MARPAEVDSAAEATGTKRKRRATAGAEEDGGDGGDGDSDDEDAVVAAVKAVKAADGGGLGPRTVTQLLASLAGFWDSHIVQRT